MASASVSVSSSGDTAIIASPGAGKFIRVQAWLLSNESGTAVKVYFKSGATVLTGTLPIAAGATEEQGYAAWGLFDGLVNQSLILNLDTAKDVEGVITYAIEG